MIAGNARKFEVQIMAGIYLHIPFCKQACHYCDFHFSTNTAVKKDLIQAMVTEIDMRRDYLGGESVQTIYLGGGTPSILAASEITLLLDAIHRAHAVAENAEVTLEANPDDLSATTLRELKAIGINRLSIGIQSFDDNILAWLNRVHSSRTAIDSVAAARDAGFDNISIDLIYAIPGLSNDLWTQTIECALDLDTPHISTYSLTVEDGTVLGNWLRKGRFKHVDDSQAAEQMETLVRILTDRGYRHYEISNFARPGYESAHNNNYWKGGAYLGIGPSAHSYDRKSRQHNIASNHLYVKAIRDRMIPAEEETLAQSERINEYILTSLRTDTGCDLNFLKDKLGYDIIKLHEGYVGQLIKASLVVVDGNHLKLTEAGKLLADKISSDLFSVE